MCMLVHRHSNRDSKGIVLQLLLTECVFLFGLLCFDFSCCAAGQHQSKKKKTNSGHKLDKGDIKDKDSVC